MTTALGQFRKEPWISSVRVVSSANIAGTYDNGDSNNGVGASITTASSTLTIDSVVMVNGNRVLLIGQSNTYENGIYIVSGVGTAVILTRTFDFQTFDQMIPGFYIAVAAGSLLGGSMYTLIEPQPQVVGVDAISFTDASASPTTVVLANNGLRVLDTNGSHYLQITPGSDLTANRIFSIVTGDAARTLTLSGNPTLADWFDQSVKAADSPTFAGVTLGNSGLHVLDTNASHDLIITPGSDLTADRIFTITTGDAARTLTMSGNASLNQDLLTTSSPVFTNLDLGSSGVAGTLDVFPAGAASGKIQISAQNNAADHTIVIRNGSHGQATTYTIPDVGAASGSLLNNALALADPNSNIINFSVTVGQAALAAGGSVALITGSGSKQYRILELFINSGGTNFSGGGGDRLGQVTDGTTVYSVVPAANMQTLTNGRWGDTNMPFPAAAAINTLSAAGQNIRFAYSGGATDYTAGSVVISGMAQRVV